MEELNLSDQWRVIRCAVWFHKPWFYWSFVVKTSWWMRDSCVVLFSGSSEVEWGKGQDLEETLTVVRNGMVCYENKVLSATQTICVHDFMSLIGTEAFNVFANRFLVILFDVLPFWNVCSFCFYFSSHPFKKRASIQAEMVACNDFPLSYTQ